MADFINTADVIGDEAVVDSIIDKTITEFKDDSVEAVEQYAFYECTALETVELPNVTTVGHNAFRQSNVSLIKLPKATTFGPSSFVSCNNLELVDFPNVITLGTTLFSQCKKLKTVILRNTATICTMDRAFQKTPIESGTGYIYVPAALVDSYKAATNWSIYAAQFRALEDYTVDGTTTGELDETKI